MNTEIDWLEMRFANALAQGLNLDPEEVIDSAIIAAEVARETVITERLKVTMLQRKMGLTSEQLRHLLECEYCLDTRCMDYATL